MSIQHPFTWKVTLVDDLNGALVAPDLGHYYRSMVASDPQHGDMRTPFQTAIRSRSVDDMTEIWRTLARRADPQRTASIRATQVAHPMEANLSILEVVDEVPRTPRAGWISRSSPLDNSVRAMFERRHFGRAFDTAAVDLDELPLALPLLTCPSDDVSFLASDRSFEDLTVSVDCLLAHRKRLTAESIDLSRARRQALVVGAGPGGLMTAIELAMRDHQVVVCEARDVYSRNRFIGVYKEVAHLMASLGMPESMTYDFTHYRGKRGIMLADIQTFLHGVALKLGVVIYTGATAKQIDTRSVQAGELNLQRSNRPGLGRGSPLAMGTTRWHYDTISRVQSGVSIRFDTIIEASGGRSGLRDVLVGPNNVVSLRTLGQYASAIDPSLHSYFDDPTDHCAKIVKPQTDRERQLLDEFAAALRDGDDTTVQDQLPCFVSNIDASIFKTPIRAAFDEGGARARIGDKDLEIPDDWVIVECPLADQTLTRYQIEGPLPARFDFGDARLATAGVLSELNPVGFLLRVLYAIGVPFEAIDRRKLIDFYTIESSSGDARSVVATFNGAFRSLRLGGEDPLVWGAVSGSSTIEYATVGEALQNAWYRFGVGVDDTFAFATQYAESIELSDSGRLESARHVEQQMVARGVQVLYHLYLVARNSDDGVIGSVLTDCYLDEQYSSDLAESRLRQYAREAAEILGVSNEAVGLDKLLDDALAHCLVGCFQRILLVLESLAYDPELISEMRHKAADAHPDWRDNAGATLSSILSPAHLRLLGPLTAELGTERRSSRAVAEQLVELAMGRFPWVTGWLRACALRTLNLDWPGAALALEQAVADRDPLVAETAAALVQAAPVRSNDSYLTVEKVAILANVGIFSTVPHEILAGVAALLTDRRVAAGGRVIEKGDLGDCLYVVAAGHLRVHDGELTISEVVDGQVVGELSLLDTQPRSSTVTATVPTHLFRLDQAEFYALMAERPEIVHAVNHALCEMVRTTTVGPSPPS